MSFLGYIYPIFSSRIASSQPDSHPLVLYRACKEIKDFKKYERNQGFYNEQISAHLAPGQSFDAYCPIGSFIDPEMFSVIIRPDTPIKSHRRHENVIGDDDRDKLVYEMKDGTTGLLYYMGRDKDPLDLASWGIAAATAWNCISQETKEYHVSYYAYFLEALQRAGVELNMADFDPKKMYAITFCNPRVHLMAKEYAVYCWGTDKPNANWSTPQRIMGRAKMDGYIVVEDGCVSIHKSNDISLVANTLYHERSEFMMRTSTYDQAIFKQVLTLICDRAVHDRYILKYVNSHFASYFTRANKYLDEFAAEYKGEETWRGQSVHQRMRVLYQKPNFADIVRDYVNISMVLAACCGYTPRPRREKNPLLALMD